MPDLRPAADATAHIAPPPAAGLAPGPAVAPASPSQGGWLARSLLGVEPVADAAKIAPGSPATCRGGLPRVLKPWGIPMLPANRPETAGVLDVRDGAPSRCDGGPERSPSVASSRLST